MWRNLASNSLSISVILLLVLGLSVSHLRSLYFASGPLAQAVCIKVDRGSNFREVSETLKQESAISNSIIFRIGIEYQRKNSKLKYGKYLIPAGASMEEIGKIVTTSGEETCPTEIVYNINIRATQIKIRDTNPLTGKLESKDGFNLGEKESEIFNDIKNSKDTRYRIIVTEGVSVWQVTEALKGIGVLSGTVEITPEEGSLSPDSYEFKVGEDRSKLILKMQERQKKILEQAWVDRSEDLPLKNTEEVLILASIIEKETSQAKERKIISSVFINRLRKGMRLETDPTVIYGLTKGQHRQRGGLLQSEKDKDTPWNTYKRSGLPPTPISNPGRASILAAVKPADTTFLFFAANGEGGHDFTSNYEDHIQNVKKLREREKNKVSSTGQ